MADYVRGPERRKSKTSLKQMLESAERDAERGPAERPSELSLGGERAPQGAWILQAEPHGSQPAAWRQESVPYASRAPGAAPRPTSGMLPYWLLGAAIFLLAAAVLVITLVTVAPLRQEAARPPLKADLQLRRVEVESAAPETPDEPRVRPLERAASAIEAPVTQAVPKGEAQPQAEIAARLVSPPRPVAAPPAPAPARAEPTAPPTTAMRAPAPAPARPVEADERPYEKNADEDEARKFLARGEQLFRDGNISAARLFFRRAAENGESQAALALGATYDPNYFKDLRVLGMDADVEQARVWYRKALELGSKDAHDRLEALGGR